MFLAACHVGAAEFFVAPDGDDEAAGTRAAPFASIQRAQRAVAPGDTVVIRGGIYRMRPARIAREERIFAYVTLLDRSGEPGRPIRYRAAPGETPVFDFTDVRPPGRRVHAFRVTGSWLHLEGFEVIGVQVTITGHTQSIGFDNQGSHNVYERLSVHDGMAIGFWIGTGSHNLVLNCDAYRNHDDFSGDRRGGNTDGFDFINAGEAAVAEDCWAFYNGFSPRFAPLADGNGFKAGGHAGTPVARLPNPIPRHVVRGSLAVRNKANGFYANHHIGGVDFIHNSAARNRANYNLLGREGDNRTLIPGRGHRLLNNLGFAGGTEVTQLDSAACEVRGNTWQLTEFPVAGDFLSLEEAELTRPRRADGGLPEVSFLRLRPGSRLVDRGVETGHPFRGAAPDPGASESIPAARD